MRKRTAVAFLAVLGLLMVGCGKKTKTNKPTTKTTPTPSVTTKTVTTKQPEVKKYTVNVVNSIQNAGTISGIGKIEEGKSTTIKAVANDGYTFLGFFDGDTEITKDSEYTITVTKDVTLTAKWMAKTYTLAIKTFSDVDPENVVEFNDESLGKVEYEVKENYSTGEKITLTATPEEGYQFNGWYLLDAQEGDHRLSYDESYDFTMLPQNSTIKAIFGTKKCTIELVSNITEAVDELTIYTDVEGEFINKTLTINYGTEVNIYINGANDGYTFKGFYLLDEDGEYNPDELLNVDYYFTATDSAKYLAFFEANIYDLYVNENIDEAGTYTGVYKEVKYTEDDLDGGFSITYKESITLTATAEDGYTFVGWYSDSEFENQVSTDATYTYTMTVAGDNYIYAKYVANDVQVNFIVDTVDGEGNPTGTINESGKYAFNSEIALTATPNTGYKFDGWFYKTLNSETSEYDYTLISDNPNYHFLVETTEEINIYAKFSLQQMNGCGHINIQDLDVLYPDEDYNGAVYSYTDNEFTYGQEVTFVAPEIAGFKFEGWYYGELCGIEFADIDSSLLIDTNSTYTFTWNYTFDDLGNGDDDSAVCITAVYSRNLYKLEYSYSDGVQIENDQTWVKFGLKTQLELPTYTGYAFQYWYYNSDVPGEGAITLTDANAMMLEPFKVTKNLVLRAKWLDGKVVATFNTDGGSTIDPLEVQYNHPITKPADPTKVGYTFAGWYNADGQEWIFNQAIVENTTLYAHWTINSYEVTIQSQDDSIVIVNDEVSGEYVYNYELVLLAEVHEGYTFIGWFENDGDEPLSDELTFTYNIPAYEATVKARFVINYYNIELKSWPNYTHLLNYITTPTDYVSLSLSEEGTSFAYGSEITVTATMVDGTFIYGWSTDIYSATRTYYSVDGSRYKQKTFTFVVPAKDVKIWLDWGTNAKTVTVSKNITEGEAPYFDRRATTNSAWNNEHNTTNSVSWFYLVKLFAYEIEGYTFEGWYNGSTLLSTELEYEFRMPYETLYYDAKYTPNGYTLTVISNVNDHIDDTEDISIIETTTVTYHDTYELTASAINGYTFLGWFIPGTNTPVSTDLVYEIEMPHNDVTYEARFVINEYEIYFGIGISNTDWNYEPGSIDYDGYCYLDHNQIITNVATVKNGWTFLGWYLDTDDNEYSANDIKTYISDFTLLTNELELEYTINAADVSIYAMYVADTYYITLNENGGTLHGSDSISVLMGDVYTLEVPTPPTDRVFIKWTYTTKGTTYDLTDEAGNCINAYNFAVADNEITAKAIYGTAIRTITFETGYDASTSYSTDTKTFNSKIESGTAVTKPEDPVKRGYTFNGWFTEEEDGDEWTFTTPISADKTLYAHWTVNTYKVYLSMGTGTISKIGGYYTYFVNDEINGTISGAYNISSTYIEIPYGTQITFNAHCYLGRSVGSWTYYNKATSSGWYSVAGSVESFVYTDKLDFDHAIVANITTTADMKYFDFTSTDDTCSITALSTIGIAATDITVPDYVTSINAGAFTYGTALTSITLPFTGTSRDASASTGQKAFGVIFGTSNISGTTERAIYYINSSDEYTNGGNRYFPSDLTTVTITDETEIAGAAFANCRLSTINLNEGITTLGKYSLASNKLSNGIALPKSLVRIEDFALKDATNNHWAGTLTIPSDNLEYIGKGAIANTNYNYLVLPFVGSGYNATGEEALFGWIYRGTDSTIPNITIDQYYSASGHVEDKMYYSVKTITISPKEGKTIKLGYGAFMNITCVNTITCPAIGTTASDYVCYNCSALSTINNMLDNTLVFGRYSFYGCKALTSLVSTNITSSVRLQFKPYSFAECTGLTSLEFNRDIYSFEDHSFDGCTNLTTMTCNDTTSTYVLKLYAYAFNNCSKLTEFDVNEQGIESVGSYAFNGCSSLTTFNCRIINGSIYNYAFYGTSFDEFTIPFVSSGNVSIGEYAFAYNTSLETVVFPNNISTFGQFMFAGCKSISTVTMPFVGKQRDGGTLSNTSTSDINYMWLYYFDTVANSEMQKCDFNSTYYYIPKNVDLTLTNIKNIWRGQFYDTYSGIKSLNITGFEDSTYEIGAYAFSWCYVTPTLPSGLTVINNKAFYSSSTKAITLPNTVTTIGDSAFESCKSLSNYTVVIPNSVTSIGSSAFASCSGVVKVSLGSGVTSIGAKAFYKCNSSFALQFNGTSTVFASRMASFATDWNKLSDTLYIKACKCTDVDYSWS